MKRLLATLALAGAALASGNAEAQEIQLRGPLAGARSVARLVRYREGRLALTPTFGVTIQDQYSRDMFVGLRAEYHFADWIGLGIWGAAAPIHIDTSLTEQIGQRSPGGTPNVPVASRFPQQVGRRNFVIDLHATFVPLRGKFALFQNLVADVDFFIFAGAAFVGVEERADLDERTIASGQTDPERASIRSALERSQIQRASRVAIAPTFGAGLNFYINRFLSVNLEYRAMPFSWNTSGTDENSTVNRCGSAGNASCAGISDIVATYFETNPANQRSRINADDRSLQLNQMVNFGLTFYLPTAPHIGP